MRVSTILGVITAAAATTGCSTIANHFADQSGGAANGARAIATVQAELETSVPAITAEDLARRIEILAHDDMEGRAPATPGGEMASQWIADEMARIGLEPMTEEGYFQPVPLVEATLDLTQSSLTITGPDGAELRPYFGDEIVYWTKRLDTEVSFDDSDMVFIGYGSVAPEYDWNDYGDMDMSGKTVVMLVNDPGYATEDPELFNGRAMTYYGRWTYKFEEAGRKGPDAALVIHETAPASYGWNVVTNSWAGAQLDLDRGDNAAPRAKMEGWITRELADNLFSAAGLDLDELKEAAAQPGFKPVPMTGLSASATLTTDIARKDSRNVGGVLRGAERPDEYILYTAHWDHLGVDADETKPDRIYNGAVDNATGTAGILEIAEAMAGREEPPARSVLFLAVTAEESGLLGSDYYGVNPTVPLGDIVGGLNIDAVLPTGKSNDIVVVGYGASELEDELAAVAEPRGLTLSPDPNPEAGYFYRSDHISLAKRGVPMLYADPGEDLADGGPEAGAAFQADYRENRYHGVADEYSADWNMESQLEIFEVLLELGENLADSDRWPNWYDGNEFRALRDAQRAE